MPGGTPIACVIASERITGLQYRLDDERPRRDGDGEGDVASTTTTVNVPTTGTETDAVRGESFDSFNVRVSTGPLASRTASPLGPTLASIDGEATEPVDRYERAMSQEIEGLADRRSRVVARLGAPMMDRPTRRRTWSNSPGFAASEDGPVIDARGTAGFP